MVIKKTYFINNHSLFTRQNNILVRTFEYFSTGVLLHSLRLFLNIKYRVGMVTFSSKPEEGVDVGVGSHSSSPINVTPDKTSIKIGNFTSIGRNLSIITSGGHNPKLISTYSFSYEMVSRTNKKYIFGLGGVEIGNDVWIGEDVTMMGGVKICDGVIVGAKSFIPKGMILDDYGIYAGVPVKLIKYRFDKITIKKLKRLKWWELNPQILKDNWELFYEEPKIAYKKLQRLKIMSKDAP